MTAGEALVFPVLRNGTRAQTDRKQRRLKFTEPNAEQEEAKRKGKRVTEFVREDVFLMDNKVRRIHTNLLGNSLTARIRRNLPDGVIDMATMDKIRRDSVNDFQRLDSLEKQFSSEFNRESSRLDKESFQMLKRQRHLQKQSELARRKTEKLESALRSRSGLSSASLLPALDDTQNGYDVKPEGADKFSTVDKDDNSHVKVFKLHGVFMPTNKYSSRIEPLNLSLKDKTVVQKDANNIQDSLEMADHNPLDLPSKSRMSKKGLRVSWSRQSRYYPEDNQTNDLSRTGTQLSFADTRSVVSPVQDPGARYPTKEAGRQLPGRAFNSRLSMRSDTFLLQCNKKLKAKRKVETIGLKWKVPPGSSAGSSSTIREESEHHGGSMTHSHGRPKPQNAGRSHNLMPVTTAMGIQGRSTSQVCWQVQRPPAPSTSELYQAWVAKLEMLKRCEARDLHGIPSRQNLSVMTQPVM